MSTGDSKISPDYKLLAAQVTALAADTPTKTALLANVSALLNEALVDINWVGFYEVKNHEMTLGPFQGKVACVKIPYGKGVCGTAWAEEKTIRVPDVHAFAGHIACDSASNSEIVLPIFRAVCTDAPDRTDANGNHQGDHHKEVIFVLDIDSPLKDRFSEEDEKGLALVCNVLEQALNR